MNKNTGDVAHVNALPVELLSEIFDLSVERLHFMDGFHPVAIDLCSDNPPLSLTQVSTLWRAVALDTLSLWDSISSGNHLLAIRHWLAVSPKIHYRVYCDPLHHHEGRGFQLLSKSSSRWKALSIYLRGPLVDDFVQILRENKTIPIKHLSLRFGADVSEERIAEISSMLSVLSLECLEFENHFGRSRIQELPWSRLDSISVTISSGSVKDLTACLSACTSATEAMFITTHPFASGGIDHAPRSSRHSLPRLTSLTLSRNTDPIHLLDHFEFPSLRDLNIGIRHRDRTLLEDFLARTPCLERFFLYDLNHETLGDGTTCASDGDIISYFSSQILRRIPRVEIVFPSTLTRAIEIIKKYPNSFRGSPLTCWCRNEWRSRRRHLEVCIGWGDGLGKNAGLVWVFQEGGFHIAPKYLDEIQMLLADTSDSGEERVSSH